MKASSLSFQAAVLLVLVGMGWGLAMAISGDHVTHPGHAHLNLLGWVSLFLMGIFYHLHPALDRTRVAVAQVWVWIVATVIMALGVGLVHSGRDAAEPLAAIASLLIFADMILFAWIVFRRDRMVGVPTGMPAE
ncbi:hypothetical protein NK718_05850 [Alsobacter sp. SYSU M60028]|uniref:Cytochrome-c oxidase n=1 Tax=Alsobacter ponti TaxID=2962936 RepID=A0ABT1LAQ1_9HYPH|nr:hypothetical protein [Alsobacter ponti]MCP8938033.1 hypothetical protein [Alsobacter ponti]